MREREWESGGQAVVVSRRTAPGRYSTYLLVVYLIRGILAGIIRMLTMFVWIVIQIGKIDRRPPRPPKAHSSMFCWTQPRSQRTL